MINAFQLTCLIIFWVVGSAIVTNPDVAWVFANLHVIFDRFVFSRWYMICTNPTVVVLHMMFAPEKSTIYYYKLSMKLLKKFPELGKFIDEIEDNVKDSN